MLRFYRQFVEQLLLTLIYTRDNIGEEGFGRISRYTHERWRQEDRNRFPFHTANVVRTVQSIHETNTCDVSLTELINQLNQQLTSYYTDGQVNDKSLIDTIVRTVQLPYARNRFSGDTLDRLKQALLLPEEAAGLKEKLSREELSCAQCGHRMVNGEMATVVIDRRSNVLICAACTIPSRIPCGARTHSIPAPRGLGKSIGAERKKTCGECAVTDVPVGDIPQILGAVPVPEGGILYGRFPVAAYAAGATAPHYSQWITATDQVFQARPQNVYPYIPSFPVEVTTAGVTPVDLEPADDDDYVADYGDGDDHDEGDDE